MTPKELQQPPSDCYAWIRQYYNVTAKAGQRVKLRGERLGTIVRKRGSQAYVFVRFDDLPKIPMPCHPTWEMEYLEAGK